MAVASWLEHSTHNAGVAGSSPAIATTLFVTLGFTSFETFVVIGSQPYHLPSFISQGIKQTHKSAVTNGGSDTVTHMEGNGQTATNLVYRDQ